MPEISDERLADETIRQHIRTLYDGVYLQLVTERDRLRRGSPEWATAEKRVRVAGGAMDKLRALLPVEANNGVQP